uniref:Uncharacterized protein n=1 Tax=Ciona savignyi TaxID=51511 RepID=H2ZRC0_CIOSA
MQNYGPPQPQPQMGYAPPQGQAGYAPPPPGPDGVCTTAPGPDGICTSTAGPSGVCPPTRNYNGRPSGSGGHGCRGLPQLQGWSYGRRLHMLWNLSRHFLLSDWNLMLPCNERTQMFELWTIILNSYA